MWGFVGNAANVAQLVGFDAAGLIAKIRQAVRTAQQNNKDCELLAHRVGMLGELLPRLMRQDPEAVRALVGLDATLSEAHDLVMSCQGRGRTYKLFTASRMADRFRDVEKKIDSYLSLIPTISYISITSRLDANHTTAARSQSLFQQEQELGGAEGREFTLAEIAVATSNFGVVLSDDAGTGTKVYKGKLRSGDEVAVKRLNAARRGAEDAFFKEKHILAPLRHGHIVHLLGTCTDDGERMLVSQYMPNGSLYDHLHRQSSSPVTTSWKSRIQVLLGAARAVEHLHCHAVPLIIHGNVASSNVLLDAAWAPRLSGFGASVWRAAGVDSQAVDDASWRSGYADPEYCSTGRVKPASDVYGLGVVMLEVLTGQPPVVSAWDEVKQSVVPMTLVCFALPRIQAGRLGEVLDRRPATRQQLQLQPLQQVATTAAQCLCLHGDNRPAISDVVANLEQALRLI